MNFKLNEACLKQGVSIILGHGVDSLVDQYFNHYCPTIIITVVQQNMLKQKSIFQNGRRMTG